MATLFDNALDEKRLLRPSFLQVCGFKAQILPDVLDRPAFLALARIAGIPEGSVFIYHAEFGKQPEKTTSIDPVRAWDSLFKFSMRTSFWSSHQVRFLFGSPLASVSTSCSGARR